MRNLSTGQVIKDAERPGFVIVKFKTQTCPLSVAVVEHSLVGNEVVDFVATDTWQICIPCQHAINKCTCPPSSAVQRLQAASAQNILRKQRSVAHPLCNSMSDPPRADASHM